jgi:hypothetical protein
MKRTVSFIKTTLVGGIIGLVPVVIVIIIIKRTFTGIHNVITPWVVSLGVTHITGRIFIIAMTILILILFCFVAGLIMRSKKINTHFPLFDSIAAQIIPGFEVIKAQTNERYGIEVSNPRQAILFKEHNIWCIAFYC